MPPSQIQSGQEEPLKRMSKIVTSLMARPDAAPFLEPVDWRGLELWDYPSVVKRLMDLGTIKRKLERNQYETAAQCAADVRQVWKNCLMYNAEQSDFWLLAKTLHKRFEDRYRKLKAEFYVGEEEDEQEEAEDSSEDGDAEFEDAEPSPDTKSRSSIASSAPSVAPTLDARSRLASNLLILNGVELGHVISILERKAPTCLEKSDIRNKMEINLDDLDAVVLNEISSFAAEKAARKRNSSSGISSVSIEDISSKRKRKK